MENEIIVNGINVPSMEDYRKVTCCVENMEREIFNQAVNVALKEYEIKDTLGREHLKKLVDAVKSYIEFFHYTGIPPVKEKKIICKECNGEGLIKERVEVCSHTCVCCCKRKGE